MQLQGAFDLCPVAAQRNVQFVEQLLAVKAPGRMSTCAMHQDAHAVLGQAFCRKQVPRQMAFFARVGGPVEINRNVRRRQSFPDRIHKTGQLLRAFLFVPEQHQEGA